MKTHLNLATRDLAASVEFYQTLLASQPVKQHDDYALFITDDPGLELALTLDRGATASSDVHYGIAVEDAGLVDEAARRLQTAGFPIDVENDEVCCYARQNKVWASDPEGRRWETYYVIEETERRMGEKACNCPESLCESVGCCR